MAAMNLNNVLDAVMNIVAFNCNNFIENACSIRPSGSQGTPAGRRCPREATQRPILDRQGEDRGLGVLGEGVAANMGFQPHSAGISPKPDDNNQNA